jgi:hypothetical protein
MKNKTYAECSDKEKVQVGAIKETCRSCGSGNIVFVQYSYPHPERHDGWSEVLCVGCKKRFGRWSGRELGENESEPKANKYLVN